MSQEITFYVETEVHPTEDLEKVKTAIENVFGNVECKIKTSKQKKLLTAKAKNMDALTKFYNLIRRERIRDAARHVLFQGLSGNTITFHLNKQAAFAGHISFSESIAESPLGSIKVQIECKNPKELIEWLAPKTIQQ